MRRSVDLSAGAVHIGGVSSASQQSRRLLQIEQLLALEVEGILRERFPRY